MPVRASGFRILQGEPKSAAPHLAQWGAGGLLVLRRLRRAPLRRAGGPREIVNVRAGTLDDTSWLVPAAHFFTRSSSAQSWVQAVAGASCFETQPDGWSELLPAWRAIWPEFFPGK